MFPCITRVALWVVVIGLLVALFAPIRQAGVLAAGITILALIFVLESIRMIARPPWTPGGDFQAESRIHRLNCSPDISDCTDYDPCPHDFPDGSG